MKHILFIFSLILGFSFTGFSQDWTLPITGKVEKNGKKLQGAIVTLMQGSKQIAQTMTGDDGAFRFEIPPNGDFMILITKPGHCTKKIQVSTRGVPPDDKSTKRYDIAGVSLFEPSPGIDYSVLNQPLVKIQYNSVKQIFDYDEAYLSQSIAALDKLKQLENDAINKQKELEANYQSAIKTADKAFQKKDWNTSKASYSKASLIKPLENYPRDQLNQIEIIIKDQEALNKKAETEKVAAAKVLADKVLADKAAADKAIADKALADKAKADKEAADNAAADKAKADKAIADKALADKAKSDKAAANKAIADKAAADKAVVDKAKADKAAADKALADKAAADKAAADKAKADKAAADKALADKEASDKAAADKLASEKALADKAAADKAKAEHTIAPTLGVNKYKEAISKADGYFKMKRYLEAKKSYEDALIAKANDSYAKDKLIEIEKILNSDSASINSVDAKIKELKAKYPLGVTEETISGSGVLIIQRVVVKEKTANVYQKKIFSWGGITYLRDSNPITESIFEQETKP